GSRRARRPARAAESRKQPRRLLRLEPLESRLAPACVITATGVIICDGANHVIELQLPAPSGLPVEGIPNGVSLGFINNNPINVNGGGGINRLTVSDMFFSGPSSNVLTNTQVQVRSLDVNYSSMQSVTLSTGDGANTVTVAGTAAGVAYTLNAGGGADTVFVGNPASGLDAFAGLLTYYGVEAFLIHDEAGTVGRTYLLNQGRRGYPRGMMGCADESDPRCREIAVDVPPNPCSGCQLDIRAGNLIDQFRVFNPFPPGYAVALDGGGGSDVVRGPHIPTAYTIQQLNVGNFRSAGAGPDLPVTFNSIENLTGGAADDTFSFDKGGGVSGTIN